MGKGLVQKLATSFINQTLILVSDTFNLHFPSPHLSYKDMRRHLIVPVRIEKNARFD